MAKKESVEKRLKEIANKKAKGISLSNSDFKVMEQYEFDNNINEATEEVNVKTEEVSGETGEVNVKTKEVNDGVNVKTEEVNGETDEAGEGSGGPNFPPPQTIKYTVHILHAPIYYYQHC